MKTAGLFLPMSGVMRSGSLWLLLLLAPLMICAARPRPPYINLNSPSVPAQQWTEPPMAVSAILKKQCRFSLWTSPRRWNDEIMRRSGFLWARRNLLSSLLVSSGPSRILLFYYFYFFKAPQRNFDSRFTFAVILASSNPPVRGFTEAFWLRRAPERQHFQRDK